MPSKEIKDLRLSGKLEEALTLAKSELEADKEGIWPKRNLSWVYYEYLKQNCSLEHIDQFVFWLNEVNLLQLPIEEKLFYEKLSWQIGRMAFSLSSDIARNVSRGWQLFKTIELISFPKPTAGYSFLLKGFHKLLKDSNNYVEFVDWWGLQNFCDEDFQKEKLSNGSEVMALVEQVYISYAKHLLPQKMDFGESTFSREKIESFLPMLSQIVEDFPQYQYPSYFKAKLLLALGDKENMLNVFLPFAKKKKNDFWVWDLLAEGFPNDPDKIFACYCKALSCHSPAEMLINLRQRMASLLISRGLYDEARTELDNLIEIRKKLGYKIPNEVEVWLSKDWYKVATPSKTNNSLYKRYSGLADALLFSDINEEFVIVDFVNFEKKIANFIASESKYGFFKYDRLLSEVKVGDVLNVRFQDGVVGGKFNLYTALKVRNDDFKNLYFKSISGTVKIRNGKSFGFIDDVFIHPSLVAKYKLVDLCTFTGSAIKSYNPDKKQWGWRLI